MASPSSITTPSNSGLPIRWQLFYKGVFLGLFIWMGYRVYALSLTHDEALSFLIFSEGSHYGYAIGQTANHHPLNTWLMWVCAQWIGPWEWSLRLPNLLVFLIYGGLVGHALLKRAQHWTLLLCGMGLFLFNPFLLDFFGLARGYGLSMGFVLASSWHLFRPIAATHTPEEADRLRHLHGAAAVGWATLAVWSNFSSINWLLALIALLGFRHLVLMRWQPVWWYVLVAVGVFFIIKYPLEALLKLSDLGELYHGRHTLREAFDSMITFSLYDAPPSLAILRTIQAVFVGFWGIGGIMVVRYRLYEQPLGLAVGILLVMLMGVLAERFLFDALYPSDRTTLVFLVTWAWVIWLTLEEMARRWSALLAYTVALGLAVGTVGNFVNNVNVTHTQIWSYDQHTKTVMQYFQTLTAEQPEPATLSCNWLFEPSIHYYIVTRAINLQIPPRRIGIQQHTDLVYNTIPLPWEATHHTLWEAPNGLAFLYLQRTSPLAPAAPLTHL